MRRVLFLIFASISLVQARRYYDPEIGLFTTVDPEANKRPWITPYAYAVNNPIRYEDFQGLGPLDRVQAAQNMTGIPYLQETKGDLRTANTPAALAKMDCAEFVCRVLAADQITAGVKWLAGGDLLKFFQNDKQFVFSETPQVGDIAAWEGHVGIVGEVGENNTIRLIHARGTGKLSNENALAIPPEDYRDSPFIGYFRPVVETPEGKVQPK